MINRLWDWIVHNNWAFGPLCALLGVLITVFFGPSIKLAFSALWDTLKTHLSGRRFENKYLEWLIAENQYLPSLPTTLVPVTEGHRHELDRLYVSLSVSGDKEQGVPNERSLAEVLSGTNKLVILGDPGSGKTTVLKFLALTFARARRNRAFGNSKQQCEEDSSKVRQARKRVHEEFHFDCAPLPIFVLLNRLRDVNEWPRSQSLLDRLREEWFAVDSLRGFPKDFLDRKLEAGQCIFLFDAFDELGNEDKRAEIARRIGELSNAAPSGNRFIVTSRVVGYSGQLSHAGFSTTTVSLLDALEANPRIKDLAVNPMLLSLIALVQYVQRLIPDRRDILYETCVEILIERRYAPASVRQAYDRVLPSSEAMVILQKIAHAMHVQHAREISRSILESAIIPEILQRMKNTQAAAVSPSEILHNIEERSQLLVERGLNTEGQAVMAFSHLTFQEYLTSVDLKRATVGKGLAVISSDILGHYEQDRDWWEEVALLFAAQLDPPDQESFFRQIYPSSKGNASGGIA